RFGELLAAAYIDKLIFAVGRTACVDERSRMNNSRATSYQASKFARGGAFELKLSGLHLRAAGGQPVKVNQVSYLGPDRQIVSTEAGNDRPSNHACGTGHQHRLGG